MNGPVEIWRKHKKLHTYLGKKGKVLSWTKIFSAPAGFENQTPFFVGIIELENRVRIPLEIVDCTDEDLKENIKVEIIIRRTGKASPDGVIEYGPKAKII